MGGWFNNVFRIWAANPRIYFFYLRISISKMLEICVRYNQCPRLVEQCLSSKWYRAQWAAAANGGPVSTSPAIGMGLHGVESHHRRCVRNCEASRVGHCVEKPHEGTKIRARDAPVLEGRIVAADVKSSHGGRELSSDVLGTGWPSPHFDPLGFGCWGH